MLGSSHNTFTVNGQFSEGEGLINEQFIGYLLVLVEMKNINVDIRRRKFGWIRYTLYKNSAEVCHKTLVYNLQGSRRRRNL